MTGLSEESQLQAQVLQVGAEQGGGAAQQESRGTCQFQGSLGPCK